MSEKERGPREAIVRVVEATYHGVPTVVRTMHGRNDEFPVKVGLHQGSGRSLFLFIVVLDVISEEFRCGLPRELLFADDLAVPSIIIPYILRGDKDILRQCRQVHARCNLMC